MSYTPINPDVFTAAYTGCVSAFEGGFQLSTNSNPAVYTGANPHSATTDECRCCEGAGIVPKPGAAA